MVKREFYKKQLQDIKTQRGKLNEEEYLILSSWSSDLENWLETHADIDGYTYVKIKNNLYYCVRDISSTIMRVGDDYCKGVLGCVLFKGFGFYIDKETIDNTFRDETRIDISCDFEQISKDEFFKELGRVKNRLFALNDKNILLQYNSFPCYLDRWIQKYPEYLGDENIKNMLNELELEVEKDSDFEF